MCIRMKFDAAVRFDRRIPSTQQVQVYELPQQQVAAVVHHGAFEDFTQGHTALLSWVEANGYQITGPYREIYIQHDAGNLAESTNRNSVPSGARLRRGAVDIATQPVCGGSSVEQRSCPPTTLMVWLHLAPATREFAISDS